MKSVNFNDPYFFERTFETHRYTVWGKVKIFSMLKLSVHHNLTMAWNVNTKFCQSCLLNLNLLYQSEWNQLTQLTYHRLKTEDIDITSQFIFLFHCINGPFSCVAKFLASYYLRKSFWITDMFSGLLGYLSLHGILRLCAQTNENCDNKYGEEPVSLWNKVECQVDATR